jgi:hypothetical protein
MIISMGTEEALNKIQHPFMIKTPMKLVIEGIHLNIIKAIYDKLIVNIVLNEEKLKLFSLKSGMRQGCSLSPLLSNTILILNQSDKIGKRNRKNVNRKG